MRKILFLTAALAMLSVTAKAVDANTVEIVYNGTSATVTVASNIQSYVTVQSGNSSHVQIVQRADFAGVDITDTNTTGEITYILSGSSTDGEFYLEGSFKATVELNGVTLTNPAGPAINIQNGKRVAISAKKGKTSTLSDGANELYNGCIHSKGHLKLKGKGTLKVTGNSKHAIYSKEYMEVKNCTINVASAVKDGLHCKEYFLMESGNVTINNTGDDGIQVEQDISIGAVATEETTGHEDENSGNFYMEDGKLTISGYTGRAIKADGTIQLAAGKYNGFSLDDTTENNTTGIDCALPQADDNGQTAVFSLSGHRLPASATPSRGLYIVKSAEKTAKKYVGR